MERLFVKSRILRDWRGECKGQGEDCRIVPDDPHEPNQYIPPFPKGARGI